MDLDEIVPGLFLGDIMQARNIKHLKENNITHIISVGEKLEEQQYQASFNCWEFLRYYYKNVSYNIIISLLFVNIFSNTQIFCRILSYFQRKLLCSIEKTKTYCSTSMKVCYLFIIINIRIL